MSAWAKPGVKCVCLVGGSLIPGHPPKHGYPDAGAVYTVSSFVHEDRWGRGKFIRIAELPNPWKLDQTYDAGWSVSRFRPLVTRTQEQDVELFRSLLTDLPVEVDA